MMSARAPSGRFRSGLPMVISSRDSHKSIHAGKSRQTGSRECDEAKRTLCQSGHMRRKSIYRNRLRNSDNLPVPANSDRNLLRPRTDCHCDSSQSDFARRFHPRKRARWVDSGARFSFWASFSSACCSSAYRQAGKPRNGRRHPPVDQQSVSIDQSVSHVV